MPETKRILVLSDLHIGAPYAAPVSRLEKLDAHLKEATHCVLNGDCIEGHLLSLAKTDEALLKQGGAFLDELTEKHPHLTIHYVAGNHDRVREIEELVKVRAAKGKKLHWHTEYCRIGKALFTHGDLSGFYRSGVVSLQKNRPPSILTECSRRAWRASYHKLLSVAGPMVSKVYRPDDVLKQQIAHTRPLIEKYKITDLCFGHFHRNKPPFDKEIGGVRFHMTGSGMRGARNTAVMLTQDKNGDVTDRKQIADKPSIINYPTHLEDALRLPANLARTARDIVTGR